MSHLLESLISEATRREHAAIVELAARLCSIPSISADASAASQVRACARLIADEATRVGFQTAEIVETAGLPLVVAKYIADPDLPTVLIYTHYDVQPAADTHAWTSPPFEPVVRDDALWARGATDDKGHIAAHLKAVEILLRLLPTLPVNLTFVSEGEEECGSPNFADFLDTHDLFASAVVISDTPGYFQGHPALTTSLRGLVLVDVALRGIRSDAHSGIYGGAIRNPAEELSRIISQLKDPFTGTVLVPGFYDSVAPPAHDKRLAFERIPFDERAWMGTLEGVLHGERGWSSLERTWWRPTLEVHSLTAGDETADVNTIVPAVARARLSARIVADQDATAIAQGIEAALANACPDGMTIEVTTRAAANPVQIDEQGPLSRLAADVVSQVTGEEPVFVGMGGSVPPVGILAARGIPCVLVGVADDSDNFHGPDEHIGIDRLRVGTEIFARLWLAIGASEEARER